MLSTLTGAGTLASESSDSNFASFVVEPWVWVAFIAFVAVLLIVDLLLVHPPFPGEKKPTGLTAGLSARVADALGATVLASDGTDAADRWEEQVDRLRERVHAWTGNHAQVVDLTFHEWRRPPPGHRPLIANIEKDGIELLKVNGMKLWGAKASHGG